ncbi:TonB-dependent receptor [Novosphingobium sp.]|uniref:TonB-dependent receptor n=1 Tax=Novosphingobium sp. TaxID=1874826 RepID=UPI003B5280CB
MSMQRNRRFLTGSAGLALAILANPAFAADAAPQAGATTPEPGEIIVTAQRRAEKVTEVPISITVADSAQLERQQIDTVGDLARIAPSLEINTAAGQSTGGGGSIRGIGTQTFSAGAVPSVGIVVDQVSQGNANISDLFDVARVEVLKGPQGTLFGLTTSAGVINITTNKPEFGVFSLRMRTEMSGGGVAGSLFGDQVVQGVMNIPLAPTAALRISGFSNTRQGPDYDLTTRQYDANDTFGFRGHLLWEPNDALTVNLIGDYSRTRTTNGGDFFTFVKADGANLNPVVPFPLPDNVAANLASCGITPGFGNRNFCSAANSFVDRNETGGVSLQLDYKTEPFTITSITAYRTSLESGYGAASNVFRADPLELQVFNGPVNHPIYLLTQELRVSSPANQLIEYTAGLFFSSQIQHAAAETTDVFIHPAPGVLIPVNLGGTGEYRVTDTSGAIFGQATIHATPKLRLIVGGRYTKDNLRLGTTADAIPASTNSYTALDVNKFSWKLGAQYDVAARTMVYGTVTRGFKGGQISNPSGEVPHVIQPEVPTAYELGLKSTLFRSWVLDTNLFYEKVQNFQAQNCTSNAVGSLSCAQTNIDGVKTRGAEINLFGKVTQNLSLNTGFIWAKATYPAGFRGTDGSDLGNTQLANSPEYKFTMSGEYSVPVSQTVNGFLAADTIWKSRVSYEQTSVAQSTFGPHWTVGGRVGVRTADSRFTVAVFARNLFNVHEPILFQSGFPYNGASNIGAFYGPNGFRQVGLSLDGKF